MQHHANLLVGTRAWALELLPEHVRRESPDVVYIDVSRMTIAHVHELVHAAILRPIVSHERGFVLMCDSMLHEAQNALLKLFEEPEVFVSFYLVIPRIDILLPTLRSRCSVYAVEYNKNDSDISDETRTFQRMSYSERLAYIQKKLDSSDQVDFLHILRGLGVVASKTKNTSLLRELLYVEREFSNPGASKKMLLEHLALSF